MGSKHIYIFEMADSLYLVFLPKNQLIEGFFILIVYLFIE